MKIIFFSRIIFLLSIGFLINSCKKDGFPVPPASTVPLFSYTVTNDGFAPSTVTFTNESIVPEEAGDPVYKWTFGDGSTSNETSPVHTYAAPGVFDISLLVKTSISGEIKELIVQIPIKNANASGTPVYFTNGTLVYAGLVNDDPPLFSSLNIGPFKDSYGMAFDTVNSKLYISDYDAKKIFRCDPDGKNLIEFRTGLPGPDGLAIDYAGNKIYWDTDDGIQRADLSNSDVNQKEDFVTGQVVGDPEGVSIDPVNRKLYWINYNGGLWSKNLDGTGEAEIIPLVEGGQTLIAGGRLFFDSYVASGDIHLKSANLDGTGIATITTGISRVLFGLGYEPNASKIYWGDRTPGRIMRSNPDGSVIEIWFTLAGSSPRGIVFGKKK